jgi:hypothetical protein
METPPSRKPIELPPDLDVIYANIARISHTPAEIVFDFAHQLPWDDSRRVQARLVMSPVGAKLFFRALGENLSRYETAFGEIPVPGDGTLAKELFRSIHPPETPPENPPEE